VDLDGEMVKVLESLVADNEDLKRSSIEIQTLLQESRDDVHALQQELEELRNTPPLNRDREKQAVCSYSLSDLLALSRQAIYAPSLLGQHPVLHLQ
jgi:hypothetical protein